MLNFPTKSDMGFVTGSRQGRIACVLATALVWLTACAANACLDADCSAPASAAPGPAALDTERATVTQSEDTSTRLEPLQYIAIDGDTINFGAQSTGCTLAEHFHIEHHAHDGRCEIAVIRDKPDFCRRAPQVADLNLIWERPANCDADAVHISNPIVDLKGRFAKASPSRSLPNRTD